MKTRSVRFLVLAFTFATASVPLLRGQVVNPGFETGNFSGWTLSSGAQATAVGTVTDYPIDPFTLTEDFTRPYTASPFAGSFQARLVAGTTPLANLETFLSLSPGLLSNSTTNPFGIADGAALAQTVSLLAGDTILLHWNFLAVDTFDDFAFASFVGPGGMNFTPLDSVFGLNGGLGSGWQTLTFTASTAGAYRLGFGVANFEDNTVGSILYADVAVRAGAVAVPEASTYGLIGALGLISLIIARRCRQLSA